MAAARSPRLAGAEARYDGFVLQSVAPTPEIPASNNIPEYKAPRLPQDQVHRGMSCGGRGRGWARSGRRAQAQAGARAWAGTGGHRHGRGRARGCRRGGSADTGLAGVRAGSGAGTHAVSARSQARGGGGAPQRCSGGSTRPPCWMPGEQDGAGVPGGVHQVPGRGRGAGRGVACLAGSVGCRTAGGGEFQQLSALGGGADLG